MIKATILVVDDEPKLVDVVRAYLEREGYAVIVAADGGAALDQFGLTRPDLVILDVMLPGLDGLTVCRRLRQESDVPIIMLTARAEEPDELAGLALGADDYVVKPFSPRSLVARVSAVLRRTARSAEEVEGANILAGPLRVDPVRHMVTWETVKVPVTLTQFRLLTMLARRPGRVFARHELLDHARDETSDTEERTVDAHVKNLRRKLAEAGGAVAAATIVTVPGVGYKLEAPGA